MLNVGLPHFIALASALFVLGMAGIVLNRKNVITILMSIELMLLAVNLNFIAFSSFYGNLAGQVFAFFILTVAAAELAIGLAIVTLVYRHRRSVNVDDISELKG